MTGELSLVRYGEDSLKARELKQRDNSIILIMIYLVTPEAFAVIMCVCLYVHFLSCIHTILIRAMTVWLTILSGF